MNELPKNLYRAAQVRELDRIAIEELGISGMKLMERAGGVAFNALHTYYPRAKRVAVVCGVGNNAGDGYVIARLADAAGLRVVVYQAGDRSKLKGDALTAFERLEGTQVNILQYDAHTFEIFDVVVDAMLGTGLQGEVKEQWKSAIQSINEVRQQSIAVLAVDIPSGLHADTGRVLGSAVKADVTVTFIGMKQGLLTASGPDYCGEIQFSDLQVPEDTYTKIAPSAQRLLYEDYRMLFTRRLRATHKGQCGRVLLIGGNYGMSGAIRMAGEAAARTGAGLITVATRNNHAPLVNVSRPELMCHGVENNRQLQPLLDKTDVVVLGPGLGQDDWAHALFETVLESNLPLIVDADALNLLADQPRQRGNWILTPHPGEAARLLNCSPREIQIDRFNAAEEISKRYAGVCILKGCGTLVCCAADDMHVCDAGNPGMASGGMGDVLSGVIAALFAQHKDICVAAKAGVVVHSRAADYAAQQGERGMLASDLFPQLRRLVNID